VTTSVAHIIRRRHNRKQRRRRSAVKNRWWGGLISGALLLLLILPLGTAVGVSGWLYLRAAAVLPSPADTIDLEAASRPTQLYDRTGQTLLLSVIDPLGGRRMWIDIDTLPSYVWQAALLMEDRRFLEEESRFDPLATLEALWAYVLWGVALPDNSLTARLVDSVLLPLASRSGLDAPLLRLTFISELNRRYTPRAVLEWYLNTAFYGSDAYGIEAAARIYFDKSAAQLTLDEAALLVPIALEPRYNPFANETAARGRQADLLRAMLAAEIISQREFEAAASRFTPLSARSLLEPTTAPEFTLYARSQAQEILTYNGFNGPRLVSRGGLRITTTLDLPLYLQSECALRAHLAQLNGQRPSDTLTLTGEPCFTAALLASPAGVNRTALPDTGALVTLDVTTGEILAIVGDVTSYRHQPAGTLGPFVYLEGFRSGEFTPATMVYDFPRPFPGRAEGLIYQPISADGVYRGPINLRLAMAAGLLPPMVGVADSRGLNRILNTAHVVGLNSLNEGVYDLSLLERGGQVSVLDMAYAYSVFAAQGYMIGVDAEPIARGFRARNPVAVLKIEDADGRVLWEYDERARALSRTNILGEDFSFLINHILSDNAARRAALNRDVSLFDPGRPAAVVQAASSDRVDDWAIGYTPQRLTAVHVGRSDDQPMTLSLDGQQGALVVWQAVTRHAHESAGLPVEAWERPPGVAEYVVCERSGMIPRPDVDCPHYLEVFLRQVPPFQTDNFWQRVTLNSQTRTRATAYTPVSLQLDVLYFIPPAVAMDWWRANNMPLPPQAYDTASRPNLLRSVELFVPANFAYVGGVVDVRGSVDLSGQRLRQLQLSYGQGLNPSQWFNIGEPQTEFTPGVSLGLWDTAGLDGIYTLQLTAIFADGSRDSDFVQVTVDNTPPTITLQAGEPGQIFRMPSDAVIPIVANVSDNLAVNRVEFYHNGTLVATDREWPYGFEFRITQPGIERFTAVVFDQVGNTAEAEVSVEIIRS
jgi:membrane peptidoglycan carboxypeptidase